MKYKLHRENIYAATLVALMGIGVGTFFTGLKLINAKEDIEIQEIVEHTLPPQYKREYKPLTEEEIEEQLSYYGSLSTDMMPMKTYRLLQIKDNYDYFKIMIVKTKIDYVETEEEVKERYTLIDISSKANLFETYDFINFTPINDNFSESQVLGYSNLDELNNILNYDNYEIVFKDFYSDLEMTKLYISVVPESYRVDPVILRRENPHK